MKTLLGVHGRPGPCREPAAAETRYDRKHRAGGHGHRRGQDRRACAAASPSMPSLVFVTPSDAIEHRLGRGTAMDLLQSRFAARRTGLAPRRSKRKASRDPIAF